MYMIQPLHKFLRINFKSHATVLIISIENLSINRFNKHVHMYIHNINIYHTNTYTIIHMHIYIYILYDIASYYIANKCK